MQHVQPAVHRAGSRRFATVQVAGNLSERQTLQVPKNHRLPLGVRQLASASANRSSSSFFATC